MSATMEFSTHYAEAVRDDSHLFEGMPGGDNHDVMADHSQSVDVAANTRRLWHDYLAQFDVTSAILTVLIAAKHVKRAYLGAPNRETRSRQTVSTATQLVEIAHFSSFLHSAE